MDTALFESVTTLTTIRTMAAGSWRNKVGHRLREPRMVAADVRRIATQLRKDAIRAYAAYHRRLQTPGRVFRIPGRRCRLWLPIASGESVAERRFGVFEPETYATLARVVRPGHVAIELGACYGEFTIHLSRLVGPTGRVYSFELFPPYFEIAERNVALNHLTNVRLTNCAVGRSGAPPVAVDLTAANPYRSLDQISRLDYSMRTRGAESAVSTHRAEVETVSLSNLVTAEQLAPDLIFMDIEGCELEVLYDLQELLRAEGKRPLVYVEVHRAFYGDAGVDWLAALFARSGYSSQRIGEHLLCRPVRAAGGEPIPPFAADVTDEGVGA